jgi:hypothetical protein
MTYGRMTVERHRQLQEEGTNLRVLLNNIDVTDGCHEADDIEGWVILFKRDLDGRFYVDYNNDPHSVAAEICCGTVEFAAE